MTVVKKLYKLTFQDGAVDFWEKRPTLLDLAKHSVVGVTKVKTIIDVNLDYCQIQEIGGTENE